ncbi:MAG: proline hydroxylase, partial [Actinobacteria bacterium]|nr:proline hydroxylase [Actinomycetota bacterium]
MMTADTTVADRVAGQDWGALAAELGEHGSALTGQLLAPGECRAIAAVYEQDRCFRATVDMARHRFGSGEYRYFTHDLPELVRELREAFYPR